MMIAVGDSMKIKRLFVGSIVVAFLLVSACASNTTKPTTDESDVSHNPASDVSRDPASAVEMVCTVQSKTQTYSVVASHRIMKEAQGDAEEQCRSVDPDTKTCSEPTCMPTGASVLDLNHL